MHFPTYNEIVFSIEIISMGLVPFIVHAVIFRKKSVKSNTKK